MAPRGRARKRLSRMDAATDAMKPLGFGVRLIHKTVKQLLKEYGGDDGWAFIEEYGYKELLEAILRDQEGNDEDTTKEKQGVSSQAERAEDPALQSILGLSGSLIDSTYDNAGNTVGETSCSELVNAVAPINVELCRNKQDICTTEVFCPPPVEGDGNSWKDVVEGQISTQKEMGNAVCRDGGNSKNQIQSGSDSHVFASPPTSPPCPANYLKSCSGSHVQSGNDCYVSTPPSTASLCPVNHLAPSVDHHPTALPFSKGVSSQDERAEDPALLSTTCPSGTPVDSTYNESGNALGETGCSKLVDAVERTHEELCSNKQDIGITEVLWEDQTSTQKGTAKVICSDGGNSVSQVVQEGSNIDVTIPPTSSPGRPVNSVHDHLPTTLPSSKRVCLQPPRRHFPCYGWIESDSEDDAVDFIQLQPMKCLV